MGNTRGFGGTALVCSVLGAAGGLATLDACGGASPVVGEDVLGASAVGGTTGGGESGNGGKGGGATGGAGNSASTAGFVDETHVGKSVSYFASQIRHGDGTLPSVKCLVADLRDLRIFRARLGENCGCDEPRYTEPSAATREVIDKFLADDGVCGGDRPCSAWCSCEEAPATGAELEACLSGAVDPPEPAGWCYVATKDAPAWGADCTPYRGALRPFGPRSTSDVFILLGTQLTETEIARPLLHRPVGATCIPEAEWDPGYNGGYLAQAAVNVNDAACDSSICLLNHFQGRVSCPYGQGDLDVAAGDFSCFLPSSDQPVETVVESVRLARPSTTAAVCSCRCDGSGPGPFCECPAGMECAPLIDDVGLQSFDGLDGSYCIPSGTALNRLTVVPAETCLSQRGSTPSEFADNGFCDDPLPY